MEVNPPEGGPQPVWLHQPAQQQDGLCPGRAAAPTRCSHGLQP